MSDDPEVRDEVVQDLYRAARDHDDELLAALGEPTPAEWAKAAELLAMDKISDTLDRRTEVMTILAETEPHNTEITWETLLADLPPDAVTRLGELYDDMPPGAQAEYDRRYGSPASR